MSLTDALAVVGAVTGTTGSILGVMAYRRDRPKIRMTSKTGNSVLYEQAGHEVFLLKIELYNAGRQPTTLREVSMLRADHRGLSRVVPLSRFRWPKKVVERLWRITASGQALDGDSSLLPN